MSKQVLTYLINKGCTAKVSAKKLGVDERTVLRRARKYGLQYSNIPKRSDTIDYSVIKKLVKKDYSAVKIAKLLNKNRSSIHQIMRKHKIERSSKVKLTKREKAILIGTLLGDSALQQTKGSHNVKLSCIHSTKQSKYCLWKADNLKSLEMKSYDYKTKKDKKTGKVYYGVGIYSKCTETLNYWYSELYKEKKIIPNSLLEHFNDLSLAVLYMDDGYIRGSSYSLCTDCFDQQSLANFNNMCKSKFGIQWKVSSRNRLVLPIRFRKTFEKLITPHMHEELLYKLHNPK
jgi:predicted transcriptional regulator